MKAKTAKKALALFLAVAMVVTLTPSLAMATSDSGATETPKATEKVVEKAEPVDPEEALDVEAQEVDDAVQAASEDSVKAASDDSVKAATEETKVKAAAEETYKVEVKITEALTNVTVTLTNDDTGKAYTASAASVNANGIVNVENVPVGTYYLIVTGTNSAGVSVKSNYNNWEALTPYMFTLAEDGVIKNRISVSNFMADVNGYVTICIGVYNPIPAKNGSTYPFSNKNINAIFQGADGTQYPLTEGANGYLQALVPANQPYGFIVSGWDYKRVNGVEFDKSEKYSFGPIRYGMQKEYFQQNSIYNLGVPKDNIRVEKLNEEYYQFQINVTDKENDNAAATNVEVKVTDPDGKEYTETTDAIGNADFEVKIPDNRQGTSGTYTVSVKAKDGRIASTTFTFDDLKSATSTFVKNVKLPIIASFYADREVYVNGDKIFSASPDEAFEKDENEASISATLGFENIAKCTGVEVFNSDGNQIDAELYNKTQANTAYAVIAAADKKKIRDGERIVVKYYYEYTDKDAKYNINIKHQFEDASGNVVYTEDTKATSYAGILVNADSNPDVDMLRTHGENWVQRDVQGYRSGVGAWFLSSTQLKGGNTNPLIGTVNSTSTPENPVSFIMPHANVDIVIKYVYSDTYLEYDANATDAIGTMYIDWARKGEVKTTKPINDSEEEFEEPQEEYQGEIQSQSVQTAAATSVGNGYQRPGYKFIGWNTNQNGSGTWYYPGQSITITQSTTLYAQWTPNGSNPLGGNTYYSLFYKFKSGTAGKSLPAKVANLKSDKKPGLRPADEIDKYVAGSTVSPVGPAVGTEVKVKGGKWIFKGYDKSQIAYTNNVATQADYTFTGTWVYEADSNGSGSGSGDGTGTGDSAQLGIILALMALTAVAGAAAVFARRRTN